MSKFVEVGEKCFVRDIEKIPENITIGESEDVVSYQIMVNFSDDTAMINFYGLLDSEGNKIKQYPLLFIDKETAEFIAEQLK